MVCRVPRMLGRHVVAIAACRANHLLVTTVLVGLVLMAAGSPIGEQHVHLRGQVDVRIGLAGGEAPYVFGSIKGLERDTAGRILIADAQAREIRVFSSDGEYLFTIGRAGEGPGEFEHYPCSMAFDPAGRLWVVSVPDRYEVFQIKQRTWRWLWTVRVPHSIQCRPPMFDSLGGVIVATYLDKDTHGLHVRLDSAGGVIDRVELPHTAPLESLDTRLTFWYQPDGTKSYAALPPPFGPRDALAHAPDGRFARVLTSRYVVELFDARGQRIGEIRRSRAGPPVSPVERERAKRAIDSLRTHFKRFGGAYPNYTLPRVKPPLAWIWYDRDGRLWVQLTSADGEPARADVYGPGGRLLFTAEWPHTISLAFGAIRGDLALGIERDELGVQRVVRLRFR